MRSDSARALLILALLTVAFGFSSARADDGGIPTQIVALQQDVQTLNTAITQLTAVVNSQNALINQLQQQNQGLQAKLGCMSKTGDDVYFTGCNVHIINGTGSTDGPVNGLGNLIIGYNEDAASLRNSPGNPSQRGGSHNLVVGPGHSYTSYGGLVAGYANSVTNIYSTVSGGRVNIASGNYSSVSGGEGNVAFGGYSSVSGGASNLASGSNSSVSGGASNSTINYLASISGGYQNTASRTAASVSGGRNQMASGEFSSVSGGYGNTARAAYSSVSGGVGNVAGSTEYSDETPEGASVSGGLNR